MWLASYHLVSKREYDQVKPLMPQETTKTKTIPDKKNPTLRTRNDTMQLLWSTLMTFRRPTTVSSGKNSPRGIPRWDGIAAALQKQKKSEANNHLEPCDDLSWNLFLITGIEPYTKCCAGIGKNAQQELHSPTDWNPVVIHVSCRAWWPTKFCLNLLHLCTEKMRQLRPMNIKPTCVIMNGKTKNLCCA